MRTQLRGGKKRRRKKKKRKKKKEREEKRSTQRGWGWHAAAVTVHSGTVLNILLQTQPASDEPPLRTVGRDNFLCTQVEETILPVSGCVSGPTQQPTPFLSAMNFNAWSGIGQLIANNEISYVSSQQFQKGFPKMWSHSFHAHGAMASLSSIWRCHSLNVLSKVMWLTCMECFSFENPGSYNHPCV